MIEMAFVVILMLSFIVGAVDLGSAYQQYGVVLNASREGARLYARLPCNSANRTALRAAIRNAAVNEPDGGVTITAQDVQITPDPASSCPAAGAPIAVRVTVLYRTQFGELLGLGDIPISASVDMVYYGAGGS
ncbi:MAG: TadE/TadG family type IV pilus assembly protein [Caldilinea sp.]